MVLGGVVPLVGPQEELRCPSGYTSRGFTSRTRWEAKQGFSGFTLINKHRQCEGVREMRIFGFYNNKHTNRTNPNVIAMQAVWRQNTKKKKGRDKERGKRDRLKMKIT